MSGRRRRRRFAALIALLLLAALAAILLLGRGSTPRPSAGLPAGGAPSPEQFGINVNRLFDDQTYSPAQIDAQLTALAQTGATVARSDALWEATEPAAPVAGVHRYAWSFDDAVAGHLAAHGLRWLAILDYSAPWAESVAGREHSPPNSPTGYAAFAAAFARRYGQGGTFWSAHPELPPEPVQSYEIWNEPDNQAFWVPTPDAARYADLYLQARDAVKAVDPAAQVIVGGLTAPARFLPAMLAARPDLRGHLDGVAIHPYGPSPEAVLGQVRGARLTLVSLGLGAVPLYVTEFGWATSPPGGPSWAPERLRPGYVSSTLATLAHLDCNVAMVVLYTWVTPERDPRNREDWFGINPPSDAPGADTAAFTAGLRQARMPAATLNLCAP